MNGKKDIESELKRVEASYVELLHTSTIEIERLKLVIRVLLCVQQKQEITQTLKDKFNEYESLFKNKKRHHDKHKDDNIFDIDELDLYHEAIDDDNDFDITSYQQQIEILQESKLTLIKSASFEIDRLRTIIAYLNHKITKNDKSLMVRTIKHSHRIKEEKEENDEKQQKDEYEWDDIIKHNKESDLWIVYNDKIYDLTRFLKYHPGGGQVILEIASKHQNVTEALKKLNHPTITDSILIKHFIGRLSSNADDDDMIKSVDWFDFEPIWDSKTEELNLNKRITQRMSDEDSLIQWSDVMSVKIDILDKQHENLANLINQLYLTYELKDIIELKHRWTVHCKTEETLFYYYGFKDELLIPHTADHKKIYHKIKDFITDLRIKYNHSKPQCQELVGFAQAAATIFKTHHFKYDSHYITCMENVENAKQ